MAKVTKNIKLICKLCTKFFSFGVADPPKIAVFVQFDEFSTLMYESAADFYFKKNAQKILKKFVQFAY